MENFERRIGLKGVIAISIGAMLGSGVFVLPGLVAAATGPSAWLSYLLAAICVLPAAISKSELATAMPSSGGTYVYLERTFGPLVGTISGLGLWFSLLLKCTFALLGFGAYLSILANIDIKIIASASLAFIVTVNMFGISKVSSIIGGVVILSLVSLFFLIGYSSFTVQPQLMEPFLTNGVNGLMAATAMVFLSFAGVTKVAAIAEEISRPEKNIPRGILLSLLIVTLLYCSLNLVAAGNIPNAELSGDLKSVYTLSNNIGGKYVGIFAAVIGIITMVSMANAGLLAASRFPFAMSRDKLLPPAFGKLSQRFLTPMLSILVSGLFIGLALFTLDISKIVKLASSFMIIIYISENIAVIVLRELRVHWYKPAYKSIWYPWMQVWGVVSGVFLLFYMGFTVVTAMATIGIAGTLFYFIFARKKTERLGVVGIRGIRRDLVEQESLGDMEVTNPFIVNDASIMIALFGNEKSPEMLTEMGAALSTDKKIEVVHLTEIPEQSSAKDFNAETSKVRSLKRRVALMSESNNWDIEFDCIFCHDMMKTISEATQKFHCRWLVKEWGGKTRDAFTMYNQIGWLRNHLSCNLAIFRDVGVRYIKKIMIVVRRHGDDLIVETASHLSREFDADITFVKYLPDDIDEESRSLVLNEINSMQKQCTMKSQVLFIKGKSEIESLIATSSEFDLAILGPDRETSFLKSFIGTDNDRFMSKAVCSVISVQSRI